MALRALLFCLHSDCALGGSEETYDKELDCLEPVWAGAKERLC